MLPTSAAAMASDIEKGGGLSRRRHAVQLLLPFLAAALLAFLLATAAFGITHGDELAFEGGEGACHACWFATRVEACACFPLVLCCVNAASALVQRS